LVVTFEATQNTSKKTSKIVYFILAAALKYPCGYGMSVGSKICREMDPAAKNGVLRMPSLPVGNTIESADSTPRRKMTVPVVGSLVRFDNAYFHEVHSIGRYDRHFRR